MRLRIYAIEMAALLVVLSAGNAGAQTGASGLRSAWPFAPDQQGAVGFGFSDPFQVDTRPAPNMPEGLSLPEEQNPQRVVSHTPAFAWTFVPFGAWDVQTAYQCRVEAVSGGMVWQGDRVFSGATTCRYGGDPSLLRDGETYRVRVRVWNPTGRASPWAERTFQMNSLPPVPASPWPADGTAIRLYGSSLAVSWSLPEDSDGDALSIRLIGGYGSPAGAVQTTIGLTGGVVSGLDASGLYAWRVVVSDGYEEVEGPVWTFMVDRKGAVGSGYSEPFWVDTRPRRVIRFDFDGSVAGALSGAAYSEDVPVPGAGNYSLEFVQDGAVLEIPHAAGLSFPDVFTVEAYVKVLSFSDEPIQMIVSKASGMAVNYSLSIDRGRPRCSIWDGQRSVKVAGGEALVAGRWYHIAGVRDAGEHRLQLYVDGEMAAEAEDVTSGVITNEAPVYVGNIPGAWAHNRMRIDELRFHNRVLPESEIRRRAERIVQAPPLLVLPAVQIDFGRVALGQAAERSLAVYNRGEGRLELRVQAPAGFWAPDSLLRVAPGDSTVVPVRFRPDAEGVFEKTLVISCNDGRGDRQVRMYGEVVPAPVLRVSEVVFPGVVAVGRRDTVGVWVHNPGYGTLEVEEISVSPALFEVFPGHLSVGEGDSARVYVVFTPEEAGDVEGVMTFRSNAFGAPEETRTVTASAGSLPIVVLPVREIVFQDTIGIGDSETEAFEVRNEGLGRLTISGIASDGPAFAPLDTALVVAPGGTQRVSVRFSPRKVGWTRARILLKTSDPVVPEAVLEASGVGARWPVLDADPDTLDFGRVTLGRTGSARLTIRNLGEGELRIERREDILIQDEPPFSLEPPSFPLVIPAKFSKRLTLTFKPSSTGLVLSELLLRNNDPRRRTWRVVLRGQGMVAGSPPQVAGLTVFPKRGEFIVSLIPEFSWEFVDTPGDVQSAWQVQVGSAPGERDADVWDSGKQRGRRRLVACGGKPLGWNRQYGVRVRVWDAAGDSSAWASAVFRTLDNRPPVVVITAPPDGAGVVWDSVGVVTFAGSARDDDENGVAIDSLAWVSSMDGVLHTGGSAQEVNFERPVSGLSIGEHEITLTAWDNEGDSSEAAVRFRVAGLPPVAQIDSVYVNGEVMRSVIVREGLDRLTFFGSDADRDQYGKAVVARHWSYCSEGDGYGRETVLGDTSRLGLDADRLGLGRHRVYYRVVDDEGEGAVDSVLVTVRKRFGRAIIVAGGDFELLKTYSAGAANTVYQTLISRRRFEPEDVVYLNPLQGWKRWWRDVHVSSTEVTVSRLRQEIEAARRDNVELRVPLLIFLAGHGRVRTFQLSEGEMLQAEDLKGWLDALAGQKVAYRGLGSVQDIPPDEVVVVVDFCFSRTFLEIVSGPGRVVIGSSSEEVASVVEGVSFAGAFFRWLSKGGEEANLWRSFEEARVQVASVFPQAPFIDVDGDGRSLVDEAGNITSVAEQDLARQIFIGGEIGGRAVTLGVEPEICSVSAEDKGDFRYVFEVRAVSEMTGLKFSFAVLSASGALPGPGEPGTGELARVGSAGGDTLAYRGEYRFAQEGRYVVLILGQDDLGNFAGQRQVQVEVRERVVGDFDGDGQVGFSDFLAFAQHFGKGTNAPGWDTRFDLDGDGEVGFPDFLIFAGAYGKKPVAARPAADKIQN